MENYTKSTVKNNDYWPEFRAGWTPVGYCDESTDWIGSEDENLGRAIHGLEIGDNYLSVPRDAIRAAGIECDYYYHATHSAEVLGFLAVRDSDVARAIECLRAYRCNV